MSEIQKKSKNMHIFAIARIFVAIGALWWVFRDINFKEIGERFLNINPAVLVLGIMIFVLSQVVFIVRWSVLLRAQGIKIPFFVAMKLHFLGLFYNNCLPGGIGGDFIRAWYVTRHTEKKVEAALSVFVDRAIGLAGTLTMAGVFYWIIVHQGGIEGLEITRKSSGQGMLGQIGWVLLWVVGLIALALGITSLSKKGRQLLKRTVKFMEEKGLAVFKEVTMAIRIYCSKPLSIIAAMLLTVLCQCMAIFSIWMVARQIGIEAHIKYYFAFFPMSWVLMLIPVSIGGAGIVEGGLKFMFAQVPGVLGNDRVVPALIQRFIWLISSLPGLIIHIKGAHLPDEKGEIYIDSGQKEL